VKDNVYRSSADAVDELKEEISSVIRITADTLKRVVSAANYFGMPVVHIFH
jgi:hypothetical protein